jgi:hypothetical protein
MDGGGVSCAPVLGVGFEATEAILVYVPK